VPDLFFKEIDFTALIVKTKGKYSRRYRRDIRTQINGEIPYVSLFMVPNVVSASYWKLQTRIPVIYLRLSAFLNICEYLGEVFLFPAFADL